MNGLNTLSTADSKTLDLSNVNSLLAVFGQLNALIEQQRWADYWQIGAQLFCTELSARAVSLYLFEPGPEPGRKIIRLGQWSPALLQQLDEWEHSLVDHSIKLEDLETANDIEIYPVDGQGGQRWHVRIIVEQIIRGVMSFQFNVADVPNPAVHGLIYSAIQMFGGNGLRS